MAFGLEWGSGQADANTYANSQVPKVHEEKISTLINNLQFKWSSLGSEGLYKGRMVGVL
jgi:hypothetical protein